MNVIERKNLDAVAQKINLLSSSAYDIKDVKEQRVKNIIKEFLRPNPNNIFTNGVSTSDLYEEWSKTGTQYVTHTRSYQLK